jgi:hypothetical protein
MLDGGVCIEAAIGIGMVGGVGVGAAIGIGMVGGVDVRAVEAEFEWLEELVLELRLESE